MLVFSLLCCFKKVLNLYRSLVEHTEERDWTDIYLIL